MSSANNTGIIVGRFYKVPFGFELPFAGRWLKAIGTTASSVNFKAANGRVLSIGNAASELLAENHAGTRVTSPKGFC